MGKGYKTKNKKNWTLVICRFHGLFLPGDKCPPSHINASIFLPVSAACGRMTQPYMIDAFSSNGLARCPSYRLSAVRPGLMLRRKKIISRIEKSGWKNKKNEETTRRLNVARDPRLIFHLLLNYVFESCVSPKCFTLLIEWIRSQWGISAVWRDYTQSWDIIEVWKWSLFISSALQHMWLSIQTWCVC